MGKGAMVPFVGNAGNLAGAPNYASYRIYGFLETQTLMALEGGMYKFV
jgi:hypothetical protein